jgi:hypothetical protein
MLVASSEMRPSGKGKTNCSCGGVAAMKRASKLVVRGHAIFGNTRQLLERYLAAGLHVDMDQIQYSEQNTFGIHHEDDLRCWLRQCIVICFGCYDFKSKRGTVPKSACHSAPCIVLKFYIVRKRSGQFQLTNIVPLHDPMRRSNRIGLGRFYRQL